MSLVPKIIPPRIPFLDERTGMVAREWFLWLLKSGKVADDAEILAAFDAVVGVAQGVEDRKAVNEARLIAELTRPAMPDRAGEIQDARLASASYSAAIAELRKQLEDLRMLVAGTQPQINSYAAKKMAARVSMQI